MSLLKTYKSPIDPSQFLRFLKQVVIKSGNVDFNIFQQQDACEVLSCILDELCSLSPHALDAINTHVKNTITCNTCLQCNIREDPCNILQVPVSNSIQEPINFFLKAEELQGNNMYFCDLCSSLQQATLEHEFSRVGDLLKRFHLKRFTNFGNSVTKDIRPVKCDTEITLPVSLDDNISSHKKFKLCAIINHSGSLGRGHYTALIKNIESQSWFHCNDAAVVSH